MESYTVCDLKEEMADMCWGRRRQGRESRGGRAGGMSSLKTGRWVFWPGGALLLLAYLCTVRFFLDYLVQHCSPDFRSSAWCIVSAWQTLVGYTGWTNGWFSIWGGEEQLIRPGRYAHAREERGITRNGYLCGRDRLSTHCFTEQRQSKEGRNDFLKSRGLNKLEFRENGGGSPSLSQKGWPSWSQTVGFSSDEAQEQKWTVIVFGWGSLISATSSPNPTENRAGIWIQLCNTQGCGSPSGKRYLFKSALIWVLNLLIKTFTGFHCDDCVLNPFSHVRLFVTQWTVACQVPLSMGFSRPEY